MKDTKSIVTDNVAYHTYLKITHVDPCNISSQDKIFKGVSVHLIVIIDHCNGMVSVFSYI